MRYVLTITASLIFVAINAQPVKLFPDTIAVWEEGAGYGEYESPWGMVYEISGTETYVIAGDTVVDGRNYKNLYLNAVQSKFYENRGGVPNPYNYNRINKYGLSKKVGIIRQDSLKIIGRIISDSFLYVRLKADSAAKTNTDYTFFDYGKTVGDTLYPAFSNDTAHGWVIKKDTTVENRRTWLFVNEYLQNHRTDNGANYLLEGIGYTNSFFTVFNHRWKRNNLSGIHSWSGINYFCMDNNFFGQAHHNTPCVIDSSVRTINVSTPDIPAPTPSVYPNPAGNYLYIDNLPVASTVRVISITGKTVITAADISGHASLDVSGLLPGIYHVQVTHTNMVYNHRIVKQ